MYKLTGLPFLICCVYVNIFEEEEETLKKKPFAYESMLVKIVIFVTCAAKITLPWK